MRLFYLLVTVCAIINIFQSIVTEIHPDEAYYWVYSKHLAWGYFDHPPMVALCIKLGTLFSQSTFGVRFIHILLQSGTIIIIGKIIDVDLPDWKYNKILLFTFFGVLLSMTMFQVYGFVATPDGPLLFFAALFLYGYRQYLVSKALNSYFLIFLSVLGMAYSKYHGFLLITMVIMSNLSLMKDKKLWVLVFLSILGYIPHLYWQYTNGFPSFNYHTTGRASTFKWLYFLEYFPHQLLVFGPIGFYTIFKTIKYYRSEDTFSRSLTFIVLGFIGVFMLSSFRGHVEPHWTVILSIPILIFLIRNKTQSKPLSKTSYVFMVIWIILVFFARILVVFNPFKDKISVFADPTLFRSIQKEANGKPVIFTGSFQLPSLYSFYTGNTSSVIRTHDLRFTQFDVWKKHNFWHGQNIFIYGNFKPYAKQFDTYKTSFYGFLCDSFQNVQDIYAEIAEEHQILNKADTISIPIQITNRSLYTIQVQHHEFPLNFDLILKNGDTLVHLINLKPINNFNLQVGKTVMDTIYVDGAELRTGKFEMKVCPRSIFGRHNNQHIWKSAEIR